MKLRDVIDGTVEVFSPSAARRRIAERLALQQMRQYDAGVVGRRNNGWVRPGTSADAEIRRGMVALRNGARELVRNNKYAAAAVQQVTAHVIGDGISPRAVHSDEGVAAKAQAAFDDWANGPVDGRNDFYGVQALAFRATVESGESLLVWSPDDTGPDGRVRVLEGDWLDPWKYVETPAAGRIVQGVEFDGNGDRAAYWLFDRHPGDTGGFSMGGFGLGGRSTRFEAQHVDHLYREDRPGQTRGAPWLAPAMMTLRDIGDLEDATLMKKKVEACLALILTPAENGGPPGPFDAAAVAEATAGGEPAASADRLRPGMVFRARPGETAHALEPTSTGDGVEFIRQQLMGVCANLAPYHFITGDPSQANYSATRALSLPFWANLDGWQQHLAIPVMCATAWRRRMRRLALETGDRRFTQVGALWAPPLRRQNDPIKDGAGELMELRAGLGSMPRSLNTRGINPTAHLQEIAAFNAQADALKLAFDSDPRRLTDSGILQAAAGYLFGGTPNQGT